MYSPLHWCGTGGKAIKLLGIDVGTGGTRALLIDESGVVVASAIHEHEPFASPRSGWAEQNPHDWWKACQGAVRRLLTDSSIAASEIACIGLSGQMHGAVLLDRNQEVLRPALIWCDQRTAAECRYLNDTIGQRRVVELTSNPALTNFTLTKLLWVRTNEPGIWRRFHSFLLPKDYVRLCLTGVRAIDVADASGTLLLDVAHRRWSDAMLDAVGLSPDCLPALYESQEVVGQITEAAAAATGLKAGTPVVAGAGDQAAGATGMGIVRPGDVSATIGTSGVVFAASDAPVTDPLGRLHTFCHAIPGRWHVMGVTQAAGLSLRWFRDNFGILTESYDQLSAEAAQVPPGAGGVLWAPYLMGERTPHLDPDARAALLGLAADHTRAHVVRAILEGVAFSLKDTLTIFRQLGIPVKAVRVGGGGARSPLWRQIQADVYGQTVETVRAEEGAAYGAALLAGVGAGVWSSVDAACDAVVHVAKRTAVNPEAVLVMEESYAKYRRVYPALQEIFPPSLPERQSTGG
ncbi:MAG TPA: xylulokinase [Acidobacteriaceae bacterium]|nr:xylulokinase [Acidobacteriaceae bacterium]